MYCGKMELVCKLSTLKYYNMTEDNETKTVVLLVFRLLHHYKMLPFSQLERCSACMEGGTTSFITNYKAVIHPKSVEVSNYWVSAYEMINCIRIPFHVNLSLSVSQRNKSR